MNNVLKKIAASKYIYLMIMPAILFYIIFKYVPIYGIQLAFKDYNLKDGIMGSPWVGMKNFIYVFKENGFWNAFKNTIIISLMKLVISFPFPIILSILISEIRGKRFKKTVQTILTFPHFLSWVIISGIMFNFLSSTGVINYFLNSHGYKTIDFFTNVGTFRYLLVFSEIWKEVGWSTIIYVATITAIDPQLYEAAISDGANKFQKIRYVIWPEMKSIVIVMLILSVGNIMHSSFDQIFNLYNAIVYPVADVLETYIYRISFQTMPNYGVSTAVGLFVGISNCIMLLLANFVAKIFGEKGIV